MTDKKLNQSKSAFKFIGKVTRIDKDNAFKTGVGERGKNKGKPSRSLRFGVKTSELNDMNVGLFSYEPEKVFMWNSEKKQNDPSYKGDRFAFGVWEEQEEELKEQGFVVLESRVGFETGEDGKLITKGVPRYVATTEIYDNIDNGDTVVVEGRISYSKYNDRDQKNFNIEKVFKIKDVDFSSDKFEEVSYFEQDMVFVDIDVDEDEGKAYLTGRIIDYRENFEDSQFVINFKSEDGTIDEELKELANNINDEVNFGDVISVFGNAVNKVVITKKEEDNDEEEDLVAKLGGKKKPSHAQGNNKNYTSEMQITGVEDWTTGVYTDEDFIKDDVVEEEEKEEKKSSKLGGKKKPSGKNPFETDEDDDDEVGDEDLPF